MTVRRGSEPIALSRRWEAKRSSGSNTASHGESTKRTEVRCGEAIIRQHPEILPIDAQGRVREFGSRKHYDHASPIYREHSRRMTTEIAKRYGNHVAVVGWQTDNEWGCHSTSRSYGGASAEAFPRWL